MKTITMDFELYEQEKRKAIAKGYRLGVTEAHRIAREIFKNAAVEELILDDKPLVEFAEFVLSEYKKLKEPK